MQMSERVYFKSVLGSSFWTKKKTTLPNGWYNIVIIRG